MHRAIAVKQDFYITLQVQIWHLQLRLVILHFLKLQNALKCQRTRNERFQSIMEDHKQLDIGMYVFTKVINILLSILNEAKSKDLLSVTFTGRTDKYSLMILPRDDTLSPKVLYNLMQAQV